MKKKSPFLDSLVFQYRYAFGHTYLDRCGQTLVDLEKGREGWVVGDITVNSGLLSNPRHDCTLEFHNAAFTFTAKKPKDVTLVANEAAAAWKIVKRNLGLNELIRMGARYNYLLPQNSVEDSERTLAKSKINIQLPDAFQANGFQPTARNVVVVLKKDDTEYRVELKGITRTEGTAFPVALFGVPPRSLAQHQREAQIEFLRKKAQHDANPMHAVNLDVDCALYSPPETVGPADFIVQSEMVIRDHFLSTLTHV